MALFKNDLVDELKRISAGASVPENWRWINREPHNLQSVEASDARVVKELAALYAKRFENHTVASHVFMKARHLYDYLRYLHPRSGKLDNATKGRVNSMLKKLEEIFQREAKHVDKIARLSASAPGVLRFLHRTSPNLARSILASGLRSGPDLQSTATMQPRDKSEAVKLYRTQHKTSKAVVVLEVPEQVWREAKREAHGEEVFHEKIGDGLKVYPHHVVGYFDQADGHKFYLNPRYKNFRV